MDEILKIPVIVHYAWVWRLAKEREEGSLVAFSQSALGQQPAQLGCTVVEWEHRKDKTPDRRPLSSTRLVSFLLPALYGQPAAALLTRR